MFEWFPFVVVSRQKYRDLQKGANFLAFLLDDMLQQNQKKHDLADIGDVVEVPQNTWKE